MLVLVGGEGKNTDGRPDRGKGLLGRSSREDRARKSLMHLEVEAGSGWIMLEMIGEEAWRVGGAEYANWEGEVISFKLPKFEYRGHQGILLKFLTSHQDFLVYLLASVVVWSRPLLPFFIPEFRDSLP